MITFLLLLIAVGVLLMSENGQWVLQAMWSLAGLGLILIIFLIVLALIMWGIYWAFSDSDNLLAIGIIVLVAYGVGSAYYFLNEKPKKRNSKKYL